MSGSVLITGGGFALYDDAERQLDRALATVARKTATKVEAGR